MSNDYSDGKMWNAGKALHSEFSGEWHDVVSSDAFATIINKLHITTRQLEYMRRGYCGENLEGNTQGLFTFGAHKDKPYSEAPDSYIFWLSRQSWLKNRPAQLQLYVKKFMENRKQSSLTKEEISNELNKIKEQLK